MINLAKSALKRVISIILLFIIGLNALVAGYGFIADPSGSALGMNADYLRHAPFHDFLIPGIVLFIMNGLTSITFAVMAILRRRHYADLIFLQGVILNCWITVQVVMLRDFNLLHFTCLVVGMALMRFGRELKAQLSPAG